MLKNLEIIKDTLNQLYLLYDDNYLFTSVLSVVRKYFSEKNSKELWTLFCALVDKRILVRNWLIPMLDGLAKRILREYSQFKEFIEADIKSQRNILESFKWEYSKKSGPSSRTGWSHIEIKINTILCFIIHLKGFLNKFQSLEKYFKDEFKQSKSNPRLEKPIRNFCKNFINLKCPTSCPLTDGNHCEKKKFISKMIPSPKGSSAFKTLCLFLRWMVRKDPDLDLWKSIPSSELLYPIDGGNARVFYRLGFTTQKNPNWNMVVDVTKEIKTFFGYDDPIRFDFALSRLGIMRVCNKTLNKSYCEICIFGKAGVCLKAISSEITLKTYEQTLNTSKSKKIKGRFLELMLMLIISTDKYIIDENYRYMEVMDEIKTPLIENKCMAQAYYMENDVVGRKLISPAKEEICVVECKYHQKQVSPKMIRCFGIKIENMQKFLKKYNTERSQEIKEKWFVSIGGFSYDCKAVAQEYNLKLINKEKLEKMLESRNLPKLLKI